MNMQNTGFNQLGDVEGFISVYPQGLESLAGTAWNNGSILEQLGFTPDDLGFVSQLIDYLVANHAADPNRIYACGFSMGGIMSHYLGCNLSDKITAIASQAGTMASSILPTCNPERAVPAMHIHGDMDSVVPIGGSASFGLSSATATVEAWAAANGCPTPPSEDAVPDSMNDGYTLTQHTYGPCEDNTEVILYTIHGADHVWLTPLNDLSTTLTFWEFFKSYSLDSTTSSTSLHAADSWMASPNPSNGTFRILNAPEGTRLEVFNLTGQRVLVQSLGYTAVDATGLPEGHYWLRVTAADGQTRTQKWMKY